MNKGFKELFNLNPRITTSLSLVLGLILVDNLSVNEQNLVGNWIISVGETILTNASAQAVIEGKIQDENININSKKVKCIYNPAVYDINKLKKMIEEIYPNDNSQINTLYNMVDDLKEKLDKLKKINQ